MVSSRQHGAHRRATLAMKFCFKLGKSASETFELIKQAYGDDPLSRTRDFEWHNMFKEGRELVEDSSNQCSDGQSGKVLDSDRRLTIAFISEMKRELNGHRFDSIQAVQAATTKVLNSIPKPTSSGLLTSGRCAEISVSMQEECILKIIK